MGNFRGVCPFYVRLSLVKAEGYYGLRDDINQISSFCADYVPGEDVSKVKKVIQETYILF